MAPSERALSDLISGVRRAQFVEANETLLDLRAGGAKEDRGHGRGDGFDRRDGGYRDRPWVGRGDNYRARDSQQRGGRTGLGGGTRYRDRDGGGGGVDGGRGRGGKIGRRG